MAEALTAQGIGFSGAPREYTGIIMARKRQQEGEEQKRKAASEKKFEDLYKGIGIDDKGKYFTFDIPEIERMSADVVEKLSEATESGDYRKGLQAKTEYLSRLQRLKQEKEAWNAFLPRIMKGEVNVDPDLINAEQSPTREDFVKKYGGAMGVVYNPNTQALDFSASQRMKDAEIYQKVAIQPRVYKEVGTKKEIGPNGETVIIPNIQVDDSMARTWLGAYADDPLNSKSIRDDYVLRHKDEKFDSEEELMLTAREEWIQTGLNHLKGIPKERVSKPRAQQVINIGLGDEQGVSLGIPGSAGAISVVDVRDAMGNPVPKTKRTGEIAQGPNFNFTGTGEPMDAIVSAGLRLVNVTKNKVENKPGNLEIKFSQAAPVMINNSKYDLILYKKYDANGKGVGQPIATYKQGSLILKDDVPYIHPNYASYIKTVIGAPVIAEKAGSGYETSKMYTVDLENFSAVRIKASDKDKAQVEKNIKAGIDEAKKWDAQERKRIGTGFERVTTTTPAKRTAAAPAKPAIRTKGPAKKVNVESFFQSK